MEFGDGARDDESVISKTHEEELPKKIKSMSVPQRKAYVDQKAKERAAIQKEIQDMNIIRQEYINTHTSQADKEALLDAAMIKASVLCLVFCAY